MLIRNWKAFADLGVSRVRCPGCYFNLIRLSPPICTGDHHPARSPDEPTIVQMYGSPLLPGLSAQEQWKAGRMSLLSTTFETFERIIRDQLGRILSPGGFDPARDIEAITVNRWAHGYAYSPSPLFDEMDDAADEPPHVIGRASFGRIAVANSDAGARPTLDSALDQAHRAIEDLARG